MKEGGKRLRSGQPSDGLLAGELGVPRSIEGERKEVEEIKEGKADRKDNLHWDSKFQGRLVYPPTRDAGEKDYNLKGDFSVTGSRDNPTLRSTGRGGCTFLGFTKNEGGKKGIWEGDEAQGQGRIISSLGIPQ